MRDADFVSPISRGEKTDRRGEASGLTAFHVGLESPQPLQPAAPISQNAFLFRDALFGDRHNRMRVSRARRRGRYVFRC